MSRPRMHDSLAALFEHKTPENLTRIFQHTSFQEFLDTHGISDLGSEFTQAFIHKSFSHEYGVTHQEQLEFLGDAVLQLLVSEALYERFSDENEGVLSRKRSFLVNEASLAGLARGLGLNEMIIVGRGEYKKNLFEQDPVLADTFEAVLAVIYRKKGLSFTRELFLGWLEKFHPGAFENNLEGFDWKSRLQEATLAKFKTLPNYVSSEAGQEFLIELWVEGKKLAEGVFPNKKTGEKTLAETVLKKNLI